MTGAKSRISTLLGLSFWFVVFAWDLYFVYRCLEALFTGEIGFGRSRSIIDINERPGWFWFAFWFQFILGLAAIPVIWQEISKLRKNSTTPRSDAPDSDKAFSVEVTQISSHGLWLKTRENTLYMAYDDFPWFKNQSLQIIYQVEEPSPDHFYWPEIDVDLTIEMIKHPDRHLLQAKI
ncbi:DUF2442 domain-containing protein [Methylomonas albis]|uniref:DUF2442 domain-containing protein n=1 Tax=Methylomonas albis TaxID=1854563 RepID=UPI001CE0AD46|nr:DUF2442 domain-containing protein [Methylomonas albis]